MTFSADMLLINELVEGLRLSRRHGDSETILSVGDSEDTRLLAVRHGLFTFETTSRGERSMEAAFSSARDARRYMIMDLCGSYRFHTPMAPVVMQALAPGTELGERTHRSSADVACRRGDFLPQVQGREFQLDDRRRPGRHRRELSAP